AEYRRSSTAVIQRRDKRTLKLISSFTVDDHIGCIAATRGRLVAGNWDSRDLYQWDFAGRPIAWTPGGSNKRANPSAAGYQDMKFRGRLLIAWGVTSREEGVVDQLEWPSLRVVEQTRLGKTDKGVRYMNEGMTVRGKSLFLLPEDGPSRLFEFTLS